MPTIEAVFLDLGNVLAFHDDHVLFQRLSEWGGAQPDQIRQRMLELWDPINRGNLSGDELRRAVCRAAGSDVPLAPDPFFALWNCHFRIHHDVLPIVDSLLSKVKVFLLSNTNDLHWRFIRPQIPQFERFDGFVVSCELLLAKPDKEIFQYALGRAKLPAQRTAYFDDIPTFVEAARDLGIQARLFTDAATFRAQLAEMDLPV